MGQASEMAGHKMVVALCCFGILMTVIYKHSAQETSLNQLDNGTR